MIMHTDTKFRSSSNTFTCIALDLVLSSTIKYLIVFIYLKVHVEAVSCRVGFVLNLDIMCTAVPSGRYSRSQQQPRVSNTAGTVKFIELSAQAATAQPRYDEFGSSWVRRCRCSAGLTGRIRDTDLLAYSYCCNMTGDTPPPAAIHHAPEIHSPSRVAPLLRAVPAARGLRARAAARCQPSIRPREWLA